MFSQKDRCENDDLLGPGVRGCRGDFDFTLLFEEIFLSIVPSALFLMLAVWRIIHIARRKRVLGGSHFQMVKLVRMDS
jgi:ATP-binding cassette subfamily C (CFTR/MRP) protein 1